MHVSNMAVSCTVLSSEGGRISHAVNAENKLKSC